jgi:HEAT repeat protein
MALGKVLEIRPDFPMVVDALANALSDTSDAVRIAAASALVADGVDPLAAVDGLHEVLHDSAHADVRASVAMIIGTLGPKRGIRLLPFLKEALDDPNAEVRAAAVEAIGVLGSAATGEAQSIIPLASDSMPQVRQAVLRTLLNLRADAHVTLPVAIPALGDADTGVRASAALALGALGPEASRAVPQLITALTDPNSNVVQAALFAITAVGPPARAALPALRRLQAKSSDELAAKVDDAIAILESRPLRGGNRTEPTMEERCRPGSSDPQC